jgi:hypothetical protein
MDLPSGEAPTSAEAPGSYMTVAAGWLGREGACTVLAAGTGAAGSTWKLAGCSGATGAGGSTVGETGTGEVGAIAFTGGAGSAGFAGTPGTPGMGAPTPHRMVFAPAAGLGAGADGVAVKGAPGVDTPGVAVIGLPQYGHLALGSFIPDQFCGSESRQFGHFTGFIATSPAARVRD